MGYVEIFDTDLSDAISRHFWEVADTSGFRELDLNFETEIGVIRGTEKNWAEKTDLPGIGISVFLSELVKKMGKISENRHAR